MRSELTERQSEVLATIVANMALVGPTFRELASSLGIKSPNGIMCHLDALEKKGALVRDPMKGRSIHIADPEIADGMRVKVGGKEFILVPVDKWDA